MATHFFDASSSAFVFWYVPMSVSLRISYERRSDSSYLMREDPRGLTQVDGNGCTPLHLILLGSAECEADLFKLMAEKCPSNTLATENCGLTPLHHACMSLAKFSLGPRCPGLVCLLAPLVASLNLTNCTFALPRCC